MRTVIIVNERGAEMERLTGAFLDSGWRVVGCADGADTVEVIHNGRFDVVIAGVGPKLLTQLPLVYVLRAFPGTAELPVFLVGSIDPAAGVNLCRKGVVDHVVPASTPAADIVDAAEHEAAARPGPARDIHLDVLVVSPGFDRWVAELVRRGLHAEGTRSPNTAVERAGRVHVAAIVFDHPGGRGTVSSAAMRAKRRAGVPPPFVFAVGTPSPDEMDEGVFDARFEDLDAAVDPIVRAVRCPGPSRVPHLLRT